MFILLFISYDSLLLWSVYLFLQETMHLWYCYSLERSACARPQPLALLGRGALQVVFFSYGHPDNPLFFPPLTWIHRIWFRKSMCCIVAIRKQCIYDIVILVIFMILLLLILLYFLSMILFSSGLSLIAPCCSIYNIYDLSPLSLLLFWYVCLSTHWNPELESCLS